MVEKTRNIPDQAYKTKEQEPNILGEVFGSIWNIIPFVPNKNNLLKKKEDITKKIEDTKEETEKLNIETKEIKMIDENKKTTIWRRLFKVDEKEFEKIIKKYNSKIIDENKKLDKINKKINEIKEEATKLESKKLFKPEGMMLLLLNIQTREAEWYVNVKSDTNSIMLEGINKQILINKDKVFVMKGEGEDRFFLYVADTDNGIAYPIEPFFDANLVYSTFITFIANIKALRDLKTGNNMNQWLKLLIYVGLAAGAGYIIYKAFGGGKVPVEAVNAINDMNNTDTNIITGVIPK